MTSKMFRQAALASVALFVCATAGEAAPKPANAVPLPRPRPVATSPATGAPVQAKPAAVKSMVPLAVASTATTGSDDLAAVRKAIDLVKKDKMTDAANIGRSVADPVARKLIEWAILRAEDDDFNFERYTTFISANPGWPGTAMFRRKAEASLWQDRIGENTVRSFFAATRPTTAKGRLALARAAMAQGDRALAQQYIRETWRNDVLTADLETQVLDLSLIHI